MARKTDRKHLNRVASLGCVICRNLGYGFSEATVHHIGNGTMGKRASDLETIPLCPAHHQHGGHGVAVHAGRKAFEANYGTEKKLLEQTLNDLQHNASS